MIRIGCPRLVCRPRFRFIAFLAWVYVSPIGFSDARADASEPIEHASIVGGRVDRIGQTLRLTPDAGSGSAGMTIPRFFARLGQVTGSDVGAKTTQGLKVQPDPETWRVTWPVGSAGSESASEASLVFTERPLLASETGPIRPRGDGSFELPAALATTFGEKLRYEPQTFKNTVGYWVDPSDYCQWPIEVESAGRFNVAILQGCGTGQGGSEMVVRVIAGDSAGDSASLEVPFRVIETGHFQNFQWRHLGEIGLDEPGSYRVQIQVKKMANRAAMDVRELQLIRLP